MYPRIDYPTPLLMAAVVQNVGVLQIACSVRELKYLLSKERP